jgi:hypothetical protein
MPYLDQQYNLLLILQHNGVMRQLADLARVPKTQGARDHVRNHEIAICPRRRVWDGIRGFRERPSAF